MAGHPFFIAAHLCFPQSPHQRGIYPRVNHAAFFILKFSSQGASSRCHLSHRRFSAKGFFVCRGVTTVFHGISTDYHGILTVFLAYQLLATSQFFRSQQSDVIPDGLSPFLTKQPNAVICPLFPHKRLSTSIILAAGRFFRRKCDLFSREYL